MDRESELKRRAEEFPLPDLVRKNLKPGLDKVPTKTVPGQAADAPEPKPAEEGESHD